jgi:hypothetical protein
MVNRRQFAAATSVERLMRLHLETSRNVQMTAQYWLQVIER